MRGVGSSLLPDTIALGLVGFVGFVSFAFVGFGFSAVGFGFGVMGFSFVGFVGFVGFDFVGFVVLIQTFSPSAQVCSKFGSPAGPQFPRQDPPLPQQVRVPLLSTHLAHSEKQTTFLLLLISMPMILVYTAVLFYKKSS